MIVGAVLLALLVPVAMVLVGIYSYYDQEKLPMDDAARQSAEAHAFGGSYVRLPTGVTHYEVAGSKDAHTVLLVHGFSVPDYIWDPTFEALKAAGFRVLRYDLFGRGWSDRPEVWYDADLFDQQIVQLLSALEIREPIDIAGLSMGGPITATFAARHPQMVRRIVLFDPAFGPASRPPWEIRTPIVNELVMDVRIAPGMPGSQREDFVHPERYPEYFAKYSVQMRYKGFRHAILSTIRDYFSQDQTPAYEQVGRSGKPVLLVWGRADRTVPFELNEQLRKAIPQAEFHAIEDAGHVPFYEHPEIAHPLLIEFLRR